jgi:hypothetical protein
LASNFHGSEVVKEQRKQRDGSFRTKSCPKAIDDYVENMGGVDTANQLRSYYKIDHKSKKWRHRLFYSLMETCMVNCWITYCDIVVSSENLLIECQASIIVCSISFQTVKDRKGKTFLKDKTFLCLLEFKRSVTLALLLYGLNADKCRKEDTRKE